MKFIPNLAKTPYESDGKHRQSGRAFFVIEWIKPTYLSMLINVVLKVRV